MFTATQKVNGVDYYIRALRNKTTFFILQTLCPSNLIPYYRTRGLVGNYPVSYSGGRGFRSRSRDRLSREVLVVFMFPPGQCRNTKTELNRAPFPYVINKSQYSLITLQFGAIPSELLAALLNKRQISK
jgi:hypothetical protein